MNNVSMEEEIGLRLGRLGKGAKEVSVDNIESSL